MAEIALDCGYPASSLKERVYALSSTRGGGDIDRCGILIYTASAGAQGLSAVSSRPLQDLRISSKAHWTACGFAQTIPFVPIMNRTTGAEIEQPMGPRAMDVF